MQAKPRMDSTSSARFHTIALCMLSFACRSWAVKIDFPFSDYTHLYSFKARTGMQSLLLPIKLMPPKLFSGNLIKVLDKVPLTPDVNHNAGEEVHSVSEPLPAYLLPQDPHFSVIKKYLQPPLGTFYGFTSVYKILSHTCCEVPCNVMIMCEFAWSRDTLVGQKDCNKLCQSDRRLLSEHCRANRRCRMRHACHYCPYFLLEWCSL